MFARLCAIAICLTALGVWVPSSAAAIVDLTWNGVTVFGGSDNLGLFGPAGPMPADTPYRAEYRFDTSISFVENGINGSQEVSGGSFYDPDRAVPLISAAITINGVTVNFDGDFSSVYFRQSGQGASQISANAQRQLVNPQPFGGELFQRVFRVGNFYDTMQLDQPGEFDFDANDNPGGHFLFATPDSEGNLTGTSDFNLVPQHLSISLVPEPASGVLALAFVGVFFAARRRPR